MYTLRLDYSEVASRFGFGQRLFWISPCYTSTCYSISTSSCSLGIFRIVKNSVIIEASCSSLESKVPGSPRRRLRQSSEPIVWQLINSQRSNAATMAKEWSAHRQSLLILSIELSVKLTHRQSQYPAIATLQYPSFSHCSHSCS